MRIAFLSPEVWPFTRVGGLAEVSHDLPAALGALGNEVHVITPLGRLSDKLKPELAPSGIELQVPVSWRTHQAKVYTASGGTNVTVHLILSEDLFDREGLYGNAFGDYEDNAERFVFFCRAALELIEALGEPVDILHVNDWTTALVPLYLKSLYKDYSTLARAASLLTIHNLGKQGSFWHYDMPLLGLGWEYFTPEGVEFYGKINFLKAGLVFADVVSTVSQGYAKEILRQETGLGLSEVLKSRTPHLDWVTNGVDYQVWNPEIDPRLPRNYSLDDLAPKADCQRELRRMFGLDPESTRPLLCYLGRLLDRRGVNIMAPVLDEILEMGFDMVLMGWGQDRYHLQLNELNRSKPDRFGIKIGYDWDLAHSIVAGSDMLLMPSRFEPCGLHQLHAMRYGTVPVVRATGGLDDTVPAYEPGGQGVGFKFKEFNSAALLGALKDALKVFAQKDEWQGLMKRAMALDFSWQRAAQNYQELYQRAGKIRSGGREA